MIESQGTFLGKKILTYDDTNRCRFKKLIKEYSKFEKVHLLRAFSDISVKLFKTNDNLIILSNIPVNVDFVNYCILNAIKYCTGTKIEVSSFEIDEILKISFPWYQHDIYNSEDASYESMVKTAYRQLIYQENYAVIARSVYIYNFLWPKSYNNLFNINNAFLDNYGITYDKFLFYGMALVGSNESYYFASNYKGKFTTRPTVNIQDGDFEKFIKLVSMDSNSFNNYKGSLLNPITKYPILETDFYPADKKEPVYLILSKACLFNRLVYGVYYDFLEKYKQPNGKNDFKTAFGYVFQEYIGILLREHFKKWNVIPEIKYRKNKNIINSVDWFLKRGNNLILIEVKQSSIYLSAKNKGNIDELKKDINQNIIKAINQLIKTEEDINSNKYKELSQFHNIKNIQKMIVIGDPLYFGNLIVNMLFNNILTETKTHIINILDFESLLTLQKNHESLFYLLESKMIGENRHKDFTEFIYDEYGKCRNNNKFLIKYFKKYFRSWKNIIPKQELSIDS